MTKSILTHHIRLIVTILGTLVMPASLFAQQATGTILGTVYDQQGAAVPQAKITVLNTATQLVHTTSTGKTGSYEVLDLPIGNYTISAERAGFRRVLTDSQPLKINQALKVDIKMEIGGSTEVVEVHAQSSAVETVSSTVGNSVTGRAILNAPLNGRNVLDLALTQPGVTEDNDDDTGAGTFNIAGGRADSVTFILDGGINNNLLDNGVVYTPNPDAVAEFRLLENNYNAEYGRSGGGIITLVTKSGTNSLHGTIFDFARNDAFNANSYFNKREGLPREVLKRQQFGFTVGGPIEIPKLVHGKDRFFWFTSYQGQRQTKNFTQSSLNVFTPAELNGDFSSANPQTVSDIAAFLAANPFFQPSPGLAAQGIIDPSKITPVAKNYITAGLIPSSPTGSLSPQAVGTDNRDEVTGKFDFQATQHDTLSITLGRNSNPKLEPFSDTTIGLPRSAPGFPVSRKEIQYFLNVGYTKVFSGDALNDFRFTAQRFNTASSFPASKQPFPSALGIGVTPDQSTGPTRLSFNESNLLIGFSAQGPTTLIDNTFSYSDTFSWVKDKHTLKFGGSFTPYQNNTLFDFFVNGEFDFSGCSGGIGTGQACASNSTGHDFADFLLGLPDLYLQFGSAPSNIRSKNSSVFAQDEWHVRPNLVLTYGLRYEYSTPKLDTKGRSFSLVPGAQSTRFVNAPLGLLFPGDKGAPRGANFPDKNDFAPRFGFAWDPRNDAKTSVRGGFGVFYDILKGEDNLQFNGQAPFFGFAGLGFNPPANPTADLGYLSQPFATNNTGTPNSFPSKPPTQNVDFAAAGFLPFGGSGVFFVDPHLRTPYTYQYNLSVQRQVASRMQAELAYVGSDSHKLTSLVDVNPFTLGTSNRIFNVQPNATPSTSYSFLDEFKNVVNANYNGLQASLTKEASENKFLGSTYFTLAYTFGKSLDNASGFRQRNSQVPSYQTNLFRAVSDYDVKHRVTFSGGWDLPFGNAWSSGPKRLVQGWSLYPIVTWRTGFPLDVLAGFSQQGGRPGPSFAGDANIVRANLVGNSVPTFDPRKTNDPNTHGGTYFLARNFNQPSLPATDANGNPIGMPTYGTLPRNFFRGPGRANFDLAVAKTTPLYTERVSLEFRVEFFNILNHAEFANPDTTLGSPTFGQITTTGNPGAIEPTALPRIIQLGARVRF